MSPLHRILLLAAGHLIVQAGKQRKRKSPADRIVKAARADHVRKRRRKPPEAGIAVPAVPPRGPLPKQGGAEAALEFE